MGVEQGCHILVRVFMCCSRSSFIVLLCASGRSPREEFKMERIPGSRFFDLDRVSASDTDLPHMLPSVQAFAAAVDALRIKQETQVSHSPC